MFDVHLLDEARAVAAALPLETKKILAELLGLLEIEPYKAYRTTAETPDLLELALWLATTPCGTLYHRQVSPDRELAALVAEHTP